MERFRSILVYAGTDEHDTHAITRAGEIALENDADLTLIGAVHDLSRFVRYAVPKAAEMLELAVNDRRRRLEAMALPLSRRGIAVTTKVITEPTPRRLVEEVLRGTHDLLLKEVEPPRGYREVAVDAFDMFLMRKCPCPVWLYRGGADHRFQRVLAAIDIAPEDEQRNDLARHVLDLAQATAERDGCALDVIHVWHLYGHRQQLEDQTPGARFLPYYEATETRIQEELDAFLRPYGLTVASSSVHMPFGDPSFVIPRLLDRRGADLLVVGTVARGGVGGFLIGNTAERILHQVHCSVLAVKPAGFRSPVRLAEWESVTVA